MYGRQGRAELVEPTLKKAVSLAPDDWNLVQQLGEYYLDKSQWSQAAEQYRHALSISHHTDHRLALGMALLKSGNAAEAAIYLRQVLRERPNDAAVHAALEEAQHPPAPPAP